MTKSLQLKGENEHCCGFLDENDTLVTPPAFMSSNHATSRSLSSKNRTKPSAAPVTRYWPCQARTPMGWLWSRRTLEANLSPAL